MTRHHTACPTTISLLVFDSLGLGQVHISFFHYSASLFSTSFAGCLKKGYAGWGLHTKQLLLDAVYPHCLPPSHSLTQTRKKTPTLPHLSLPSPCWVAPQILKSNWISRFSNWGVFFTPFFLNLFFSVLLPELRRQSWAKNNKCRSACKKQDFLFFSSSSIFFL